MTDLSNRLEDSQADNANMMTQMLELEMKMQSLLTEVRSLAGAASLARLLSLL